MSHIVNILTLTRHYFNLKIIISFCLAVVDERIDGTWCVNYNFTWTNRGYSVKIVTQGANVTILNPTYPDPNFSGAFTTGSGNTRAGAAAVGWAPIYLGSSPCGKVQSSKL
jgi:hypothetical protein